MKRKGVLLSAIILVALVLCFVFFRSCGKSSVVEDNTGADTLVVNLLYGIDIDCHNVEQSVVGSGETMGQIFARYGVSAAQVDAIGKKSEPVFSLAKIRAGNDYSVFMSKDSTARLNYLVYEITQTEYLVIDLCDSIDVHMAEKEVTLKRVMKEAEINSSFWNAMIDNGMSPSLSQELSDIYAWTIDFFAIQKGDKFGVIYDERYVDTTNIGVGTIWGAWFEFSGKRYYALPFRQEGKISYWDENGNSLRKAFLKAPLKFSRISSRFSNSRLHPVLRIRRPHHGVDYAAPSGTPVYAIGDGTVIFKGYSGGGGNTIKIRHNSGGLVSGYLHLKGYGKGIANGKHVRQGDLIGYVGSTGLSTGPHLDFRIWRGGTPIDPLKIPSEPAEPISTANKQAFNGIKDKIISELNGTLADSLRVTTLE